MANKSIAKHVVPEIDPSQDEWLRLAAFIDGEGHIAIYRRQGVRPSGRPWSDEHMYITIVNTDPRLSLWCRRVFGGKIFVDERLKLPNAKPLYCWKMSSTPALWILKGCLPHFLLKREQAEIAIAYQQSRRGKGRIKGHKGNLALTQAELDQRAFYHDEIRRVRAETIPFPEADSSSIN